MRETAGFTCKRRAGGESVLLETAGFPLGTLAGEEWGELQLDLRPGDVVLLFTDGVVEAKNRQGEEFGFVRLAQAVAQGQSSGEMLSTVE